MNISNFDHLRPPFSLSLSKRHGQGDIYHNTATRNHVLGYLITQKIILSDVNTYEDQCVQPLSEFTSSFFILVAFRPVGTFVGPALVIDLAAFLGGFSSEPESAAGRLRLFLAVVFFTGALRLTGAAALSSSPSEAKGLSSSTFVLFLAAIGPFFFVVPVSLGSAVFPFPCSA